MSCCPNPKPNIMQCAKNNSGIKPLTFVPRVLRVVPTRTLLGLCLTLTLRHSLVSSRVRKNRWPRKKDGTRTLRCSRIRSNTSSFRYRQWFWFPNVMSAMKVKCLFLWCLCKFVSVYVETRETSVSKNFACPCVLYYVFNKTFFTTNYCKGYCNSIPVGMLPCFSGKVINALKRVYFRKFWTASTNEVAIPLDSRHSPPKSC